MEAVKGEESDVEEEEEEEEGQDDEEPEELEDFKDQEKLGEETYVREGLAPESKDRHSPLGSEEMQQDTDSENERLSPPSHSRPLSRSPPQSRSPSPNSVSKMMESLNLSEQRRSGIKEIVSSDLGKQRSRQHRKYHSKRSAQRVGRPKGSKAKQDTRVKLDRNGIWE